MSDSDRLPLIGLTTYLERAKTGVWDVPASFLPKVYFDAVEKAGGIAVLLPPQAGQIQIQVEDEGPGIPEESQEAVFQPFRRLEASRNRETGGVGLGLPIARNILRAHGGDVVVRNRPEGGLLAVATLPA